MLAQILGGSKTSTVDDFNPYMIAKRKAAARRGLRITGAEAANLLKHLAPKTKI
jgi:hypothetical protein